MASPPRTLRAPLRVVCFGGGTGLSTLLTGLARRGALVEVTAVVAVSDDGGSSGRLRAELGGGAVGDARACLAALAADAEWGRLLEHRFRTGPLAQHAVGNLLLAAGREREGSLSGSLQRLGRLVGARGRVLPATDAAPVLLARLTDGRLLEGETRLASVAGAVEELRLWPDVVVPAPGVLEAVGAAELIVLGPGSLFSSVLAATLATGVPRALRRSAALKVLVQNLTTQRGETDELGVADHARAVLAHLGRGSLDAVLVHDWSGQPPVQGLEPDPRGLAALGLQEWRARVATNRGRGRLHEPERLVEALLRFAREAARVRSA